MSASARRLLLLLVLLSGCPARGGHVGTTPPRSGDYEAGVRAFRAARWDEAVTSLSRYLADAPDGAEAEAAAHYLAVAQAERGDCAAARAALGQLVARWPGSSLLGDTRAAVLACRPGQGRVTLDRAGAERALDDAIAAGDARQAVLMSNRVTALGGSLDEARRAAVASAVDALDAAALTELWPLLEPAAFPAGEVAYRRVLIALHVGDLAAARALVSDILDAARHDEAAALVTAAEARAQVAPLVIGVLLPLSGPRAKLGAELRAGIELAAAGGPAKLVFVDTAGEELLAAQAVDELVERAHPVALLGPVGERESAAAAARAAIAGVPIALLSPVDGLADGHAVFTLWSSGEDRARLAARAAVGRGHEAPAVLAPRDDAGRAQAAAFVEEAARLGVTVVRAGEYDPTGTDLEPDVKAFLGLDPAKNERLRKHLAKHKKDGWKSFSPDVDFDLVFIPDAAERAALIVAFLVYFNVELRTAEQMDQTAFQKKHGGRLPSFVQLLGSAGWQSAELALRGGADVEWAMVVDVFFAAEPQSEVAAAFTADFHDTHGRAPSSLAAQAFDATTLLLAARAASGGTREGLARALAGGELQDGACGAARVVAGELERGGVLLRVDGGELVAQEVILPAWQAAP